MIKITALIAGLALAFNVQAQNNLPTTPVKDLKGTNIAFNEIIQPGKVTLISFWATWCIPCKKEIKNIKGKLEAWQAETPNLEYVTISMDDARATSTVRSYAKAQGWKFPTYQDANSDLKRSLNFQNVPYTLIIDKEGNIAYMHSGYEEGNEDLVYEKIKELSAK